VLLHEGADPIDELSSFTVGGELTLPQPLAESRDLRTSETTQRN
jgi:hypothetical protein